MRAFIMRSAAALAVLAGAGCGEKTATRSIMLATTTSVEASGLLEVLLPPFSEKYGIGVNVIAVGTGSALRLGENGDVDVLLTHARRLELEFVEKGFGTDRREVMHNDFVLVGPTEDPAGVRGMADAAGALARIAASAKPFISRGDESGTHEKEKELWAAAAVEPRGAWYMSAGRGMSEVLAMAHEKGAYTLADRGTYAALRSRRELALEVLVQGDRRLFNPYSIIAVNPARHAHVKYAEAMTLVAWLTSPEGQAIIASYEVGGERLFSPDAAQRD